VESGFGECRQRVSSGVGWRHPLIALPNRFRNPETIKLKRRLCFSSAANLQKSPYLHTPELPYLCPSQIGGPGRLFITNRFLDERIGDLSPTNPILCRKIGVGAS
jgi:hypothetical protein